MARTRPVEAPRNGCARSCGRAGEEVMAFAMCDYIGAITALSLHDLAPHSAFCILFFSLVFFSSSTFSCFFGTHGMGCICIGCGGRKGKCIWNWHLESGVYRGGNGLTFPPHLGYSEVEWGRGSGGRHLKVWVMYGMDGLSRLGEMVDMGRGNSR